MQHLLVKQGKNNNNSNRIVLTGTRSVLRPGGLRVRGCEALPATHFIGGRRRQRRHRGSLSSTGGNQGGGGVAGEHLSAVNKGK